MKLGERHNEARQSLQKALRAPLAVGAVAMVLAVQAPETKAGNSVPITVPITNLSNSLRNAMPSNNQGQIEIQHNQTANAPADNKQIIWAGCNYNVFLEQKLNEAIENSVIATVGRVKPDTENILGITSGPQDVNQKEEEKGCEKVHYIFGSRLTLLVHENKIYVNGSANALGTPCEASGVFVRLMKDGIRQVYSITNEKPSLVSDAAGSISMAWMFSSPNPHLGSCSIKK